MSKIDKNDISDVEHFLKALETFEKLGLLRDREAIDQLKEQLVKLADDLYNIQGIKLKNR